MTKQELKIVFFGTPEFAVESLNALVENDYNVACVVTMPDKIAGRGHKLIQSDVKKYAVDHSLRLLQPEKLKSEEFVNELRAIDADLFIVIAFRMLPEVVWQMPRLGTFNLHASLLPKYRGAAPINHAIINGDTQTGVTTFFLKHEIDTGDIIAQDSIDILPADNAGTVHDKLMHLGSRKVLETVESILNDSLKTMPQPDGEFSPAPKIFKETCLIDWCKTAEEIHNLIRGLSPYPAAWSVLEIQSGSDIKNIDVKIFESKVSDIHTNHHITAGDVMIKDKKMYVATADKYLEIISLQPAGKKRMDAQSFLLGYRPEKFVTNH